VFPPIFSMVMNCKTIQLKTQYAHNTIVGQTKTYYNIMAAMRLNSLELEQVKKPLRHYKAYWWATGNGSKTKIMATIARN